MSLSTTTESELRSAFESCLNIMRRTDDSLARVATIEPDGQPSSAVACVIGFDATNETTRTLDQLMEQWHDPRTAKQHTKGKR